MKEATGELNMTVVTVVAIAALLAFFYAVIWPGIKVSMALTTACNSDGLTGTYKSGDQSSTEGGVTCSKSGQTVSCTYKSAGNTSGTTRTCGTNKS